MEISPVAAAHGDGARLRPCIGPFVARSLHRVTILTRVDAPRLQTGGLKPGRSLERVRSPANGSYGSCPSAISNEVPMNVMNYRLPLMLALVALVALVFVPAPLVAQDEPAESAAAEEKAEEKAEETAQEAETPAAETPAERPPKMLRPNPRSGSTRICRASAWPWTLSGS
jgi:hypothetical protein